jgi:hypothetical protein
MTNCPELSGEEKERAKKENEEWNKKATYWHNAIPNFDARFRQSLTRDVQTKSNIEQLELNKKLHTGIHWHNWISIIVSVLNLILLIINLIILFRNK